jgi:uncharacterized protein (DUF2267 family)
MRMHVRYDEFLGHVQHSAGLASRAEDATCAALETLAERLVGGEVHDLAAQLFNVKMRAICPRSRAFRSEQRETRKKYDREGN